LPCHHSDKQPKVEARSWQENTLGLLSAHLTLAASFARPGTRNALGALWPNCAGKTWISSCLGKNGLRFNVAVRQTKQF
jgi:hypothetical protein